MGKLSQPFKTLLLLGSKEKNLTKNEIIWKKGHSSIEVSHVKYLTQYSKKFAFVICSSLIRKKEISW